MKQNVGQGMNQDAELVKGGKANHGIGFSTHYKIECFGADGKEKWIEEFDNLVVDAGLDDNLDKYFKGSAYSAAFYVGLTDGTPTVAAADVMSSHVGWVTVTPYSDTNDPGLTLGTVTSQSVDNSASKAVFNINATQTVGGAFVKDNNTKGGATGLLYGVGAFAADKAVTSGDTLNVTITLTAAAV